MGGHDDRCRGNRRRGAGPGPSRVGDRHGAVAGSRGEAEHGAGRADTGAAATGVRSVAAAPAAAEHTAATPAATLVERPAGTALTGRPVGADSATVGGGAVGTAGAQRGVAAGAALPAGAAVPVAARGADQAAPSAAVPVLSGRATTTTTGDDHERRSPPERGRATSATTRLTARAATIAAAVAAVAGPADAARPNPLPTPSPPWAPTSIVNVAHGVNPARSTVAAAPTPPTAWLPVAPAPPDAPVMTTCSVDTPGGTLNVLAPGIENVHVTVVVPRHAGTPLAGGAAAINPPVISPPAAGIQARRTCTAEATFRGRALRTRPIRWRD
jgi:hypothetical protein